MAQKVQFQDRLSTALLAAGSRPEFDHHNGHGHGHEHGGVAHLHDAATGTWTPVEHGHTHEHLENPGKYSERNMPDFSARDFEERAFTIGIGGPVGSGKTALLLALCRAFRDEYNIAVVTNDIFTKEDQEFLIRNNALEDQGRVRAVETGGCPHAAIREDISANMHALEELQGIYETELLFVESGGDNLAANYSRELADYIIYVIDVSGGDKVPRKGGPGISQSDLLIVNKIDLAPYVGASLDVMKRDAAMMREGGPTIFASIRHDDGVQEIKEAVLGAWKVSGAQGKGRPLGNGKGKARA